MSFEIRNMFDSIAGRYDALNRVLSSGRDLRWRRKAVSLLSGLDEDALVLDLCGGTGDFTLALRKSGFYGHCILGDFSLPMLALSRSKAGLQSFPLAMDALAPPFREESFDAVLCAFGMRNLDDLEAGLRAAHGLLKPGGSFLTLEFFRPATPFTRFFHKILAPLILPLAGWIFGSQASAYAYLADSVAGFSSVAEYEKRCRVLGFSRIQTVACDFGVAHAVLAVKGK